MRIISSEKWPFVKKRLLFSSVQQIFESISTCIRQTVVFRLLCPFLFLVEFVEEIVRLEKFFNQSTLSERMRERKREIGRKRETERSGLVFLSKTRECGSIFNPLFNAQNVGGGGGVRWQWWWLRQPVGINKGFLYKSNRSEFPLEIDYYRPTPVRMKSDLMQHPTNFIRRDHSDSESITILHFLEIVNFFFYTCKYSYIFFSFRKKLRSRK